MKKNVFLILFGVICYLVSFSLLNNEGVISTTLNALGFVSIVGGLYGAYKARNRQNN